MTPPTKANDWSIDEMVHAAREEIAPVAARARVARRLGPGLVGAGVSAGGVLTVLNSAAATASAGGVGSQAGLTSSAAASWVSAQFIAKAAVVAAFAGAGAGGVYVAESTRENPLPPNQVTAPAKMPQQATGTPAPPPPEAALSPLAPSSPPSHLERSPSWKEPQFAQKENTGVRRTSRQPKQQPNLAVLPASDDDLSEQVRSLAHASRLLESGEHEAASEALAKKMNGPLEPEITALRIIAKCRAESPEGQKLLAQFTRQHPGSILAQRLLQECTSPAPAGSLTPKQGF